MQRKKSVPDTNRLHEVSLHLQHTQHQFLTDSERLYHIGCTYPIKARECLEHAQRCMEAWFNLMTLKSAFEASSSGYVSGNNDSVAEILGLSRYGVHFRSENLGLEVPDIDERTIDQLVNKSRLFKELKKKSQKLLEKYEDQPVPVSAPDWSTKVATDVLSDERMTSGVWL